MSDPEKENYAFPRHHTHHTFGGMTMLDWFATYASEEDIEKYMYFGKEMTARSREEAKYAYARAMIEARESETKDI